MNRAISAAVLGIAVAAAAAFGASSASAAKPGTVKASTKVVSTIVADTATTTPATCFRIELARSNRSWGLMILMGGDNWRDCGWVVDSGALVHKVKGKWTFVESGYGVLNFDCAYLRKTLEESGAKKAVFRDFKNGRFGRCSGGNG
jgi:hypothetical protein